MSAFFLELYATIRLSVPLWPMWIWVLAWSAFVAIVVSAIVQSSDSGTAQRVESIRRLFLRGVAGFALIPIIHVIGVGILLPESTLWVILHFLLVYVLFGVVGAGWGMLMTRCVEPFWAFWGTFLPMPLLTLVPQVVAYATRPESASLFLWTAFYAIFALVLVIGGFTVSRRAWARMLRVHAT